MPERMRSLRKERVRILRTLDLLIIDEISMVRADILDAIDDTLKRYRRKDRIWSKYIHHLSSSIPRCCKGCRS